MNPIVLAVMFASQQPFRETERDRHARELRELKARARRARRIARRDARRAARSRRAPRGLIAHQKEFS